jgi:hypothetical protein
MLIVIFRRKRKRRKNKTNKDSKLYTFPDINVKRFNQMSYQYFDSFEGGRRLIG